MIYKASGYIFELMIPPMFRLHASKEKGANM